MKSYRLCSFKPYNTSVLFVGAAAERSICLCHFLAILAYFFTFKGGFCAYAISSEISVAFHIVSVNLFGFVIVIIVLP